MSRFVTLASLWLAAGLTLYAIPAFAQTANELRIAGSACEQPDGFMRALDPAVQAGVDAINAQRRQVYQQQAANEGIDLAAVGAVYAQQISAQPNYRAC